MNAATVPSRARHALMNLARGVLRRSVSVDAQGMIESSVRLRGRTLNVWTRPGTIDADLVSMILCEASEYRLPAAVSPRVIFDVGANIGATALYFAMLFPEADIYCFEPLPENLAVLRRNAAANSERIRVIPCGLSDVAGSFDYYMSGDPRNFGGGGFKTDVGGDRRRRVSLPVRTVGEVLDKLGVERVDLFKLDTEGSELPILRAIPEPIRRGAQAFIGELHGVGDWDFCNLLAPTHRLQIEKRLDRGCFPFVALRNDLPPQW